MLFEFYALQPVAQRNCLVQKNVVPEKTDQLDATINNAHLFGNEITHLVLHYGHLVFYIRSKAIVQIPGVKKSEKKTGRGKTFIAVDNPGV